MGKRGQQLDDGVVVTRHSSTLPRGPRPLHLGAAGGHTVNDLHIVGDCKQNFNRIQHLYTSSVVVVDIFYIIVIT
nr:MAG TPA: hypothetical protein [Bacteriophage sp.]